MDVCLVFLLRSSLFLSKLFSFEGFLVHFFVWVCLSVRLLFLFHVPFRLLSGIEEAINLNQAKGGWFLWVGGGWVGDWVGGRPCRPPVSIPADSMDVFLTGSDGARGKRAVSEQFQSSFRAVSEQFQSKY